MPPYNNCSIQYLNASTKLTLNLLINFHPINNHVFIEKLLRIDTHAFTGREFLLK